MKRGYSMMTRQRQSQSIKVKLIAGGCAVFGIACFSLLMYMNLGVNKTAVAAPGKDGAVTITSANTIVNEYTTLTSNVSASATQIVVASNGLNSNSRFGSSLANGDLVLIIQMQGASISTTDASGYGAVSAYNNAGKYELADVAGVVSSDKINLVNPLKNTYTATGKVQVVRVPRYMTLTVNVAASVTVPAWNGSTGGVLAMEVNGDAVINGTINVAGKGFRGGALEQNSCLPGNHSTWRSSNSNDGAEKGESVAGYGTTYDGLSGRYGRGAPANGGGGGNSHNAAGGGGANGGVVASWTGKGNPDLTNPAWLAIWNLEGSSFGSSTSSGGGRGGYSYSDVAANPTTKAPGNSAWAGDRRYNVGGYGGRPLDYSGGRIFMGGGGGAGDSNDGTGTGGGAGGGIVLITGGTTVSGAGTINANGASAGTTTGPNGRDGSGGGGGGGAVIIYTRGGNVSNLSINATGGTGGNQDLTVYTEAEGAGGGGGGGYIAVTASSALTTNVSAGTMGSSNSPTMTLFTSNGGTKGSVGTIGSPPGNPYSTTSSLPVELTSFEAKLVQQTALINWKTASEKNNDYFNIERSADGKNFEIIGTVNGAGNSSASRSYSFTDYHILDGVSYYRLKQTDYDGKFEYFKIVKITADAAAEPVDSDIKIITVGPNPFIDNFNAELKAPHAGMAEIQLMGINGQLVHKEIIETNGGNTVYVYHDEKKLASGIYFVRVVQEGKVSQSFRIIKK